MQVLGAADMFAEVRRPKRLKYQEAVGGLTAVAVAEPGPGPVAGPEPVADAEPGPVPVPDAEPGPVAAERAPVRAVAGLPPLPAVGVDFSVDEPFLGITGSQDRVIEALHRDGWTLVRLFTEPRAMLPLPAGKFPPGRVYLFADGVAVVVVKDSGSVVTSLPAVAALKTLLQYTPDVLAGDRWASARWAEYAEALGGPGVEAMQIDSSPRWLRQQWYDRSGSAWTVRHVHDGAKVLKDNELVHLVADADAAEELGLHPVLVELVAYVTGETPD
jgi:hypothetical protein